VESATLSTGVINVTYQPRAHRKSVARELEPGPISRGGMLSAMRIGEEADGEHVVVRAEGRIDQGVLVARQPVPLTPHTGDATRLNHSAENSPQECLRRLGSSPREEDRAWPQTRRAYHLGGSW
jgi:hypothetical protein